MNIGNHSITTSAFAHADGISNFDNLSDAVMTPATPTYEHEEWDAPVSYIGVGEDRMPDSDLGTLAFALIRPDGQQGTTTGADTPYIPPPVHTLFSEQSSSPPISLESEMGQVPALALDALTRLDEYADEMGLIRVWRDVRLWNYLLKLQGWEGEDGLSKPKAQQHPAKLAAVLAVMKARSIAMTTRTRLKALVKALGFAALVPSRITNGIKAVRRLAEILAALEHSGWATALATSNEGLHRDLGIVMETAMEPLPSHPYTLMTEGLRFAAHIHEANTWSPEAVQRRTAQVKNGSGMSAWLEAYRILPFLLEIAEETVPVHVALGVRYLWCASSARHVRPASRARKVALAHLIECLGDEAVAAAPPQNACLEEVTCAEAAAISAGIRATTIARAREVLARRHETAHVANQGRSSTSTRQEDKYKLGESKTPTTEAPAALTAQEKQRQQQLRRIRRRMSWLDVGSDEEEQAVVPALIQTLSALRTDKLGKLLDILAPPHVNGVVGPLAVAIDSSESSDDGGVQVHLGKRKRAEGAGAQ